MEKPIWPINVLALSSQYSKFFRRGSSVRLYIETGLSVLNEKLEIDQKLVKEAEKTVDISAKTIELYAKAHINAFRFLGRDHEELRQRLEAAQAKGRIPADLQGVACLTAGGITDWTQVQNMREKFHIQKETKLKNERVGRLTKGRQEVAGKLETAGETIRRQQKELDLCRDERDKLIMSRGELRKILNHFLGNFRKKPVQELAEMLEHMALFAIHPQANHQLQIAAEEIRYRIADPTALLFHFPEKSKSGRSIDYDEQFLGQVAEKFAKSVKHMTALRSALEKLIEELDVESPKLAKIKLPFALPRGYERADVFRIAIGDEWVALYFMKRLKERSKVTIRFLQKSE